MKIRHFLKPFALCGAVLTMLCSLAIPAQAARQYPNCIGNCKVYDEGNLLDDEEEKSINELLAKTSETVDMYVAIAFYGEDSGFYSDYEVEVKADDTFDALFNVEPTVASDGLMLLIDYATRYIYITTCGLGEMYYYNGSSDDRIAAMNSHLTNATRNEDFIEIAQIFCADVVDYYHQGVPKDAYTYNNDTGKYLYSQDGELISADRLPKLFGFPWGKYIGAGLIVGFFPALIVFCLALVAYKKKTPLTPTAYTSGRDTNYRVRDDIFLNTNTTHTYIDTDSTRGGGGGGGGSSHSSGGGFSHGGGGSHF